MKAALIVGVGGALGSIARYKLSGWILHYTVAFRFPVGTFAVNVLGCLLIGVLAGLAAREDYFSQDVRLFFFTGVLGGFTTFSAFGLETFYLLKRDDIAVAGGYILASLYFGLVALWAGFSVIPHLFDK